MDRSFASNRSAWSKSPQRCRPPATRWHWRICASPTAWTGWCVADFERLWGFIDGHALYQAGFTILTPLPGTSYYEHIRSRLHQVPWSHFDMHHLLWEPALGAQRFFALYCETWKRSVLNLRGRKSLWGWMREVDVKNAAFLVAALHRTQRMMDPAHYLAEYGDGARAAAGATSQEARRSWVPAGD